MSKNILGVYLGVSVGLSFRTYYPQYPTQCAEIKGVEPLPTDLNVNQRPSFHIVKELLFTLSS